MYSFCFVQYYIVSLHSICMILYYTFLSAQELDVHAKKKGLQSVRIRQFAHEEDRVKALTAMRESGDLALSSIPSNSTPVTGDGTYARMFMSIHTQKCL